jgi:perosamine synthetase
MNKRRLAKKVASPVFDLTYRFLMLPLRIAAPPRVRFGWEELKLLHRVLLSQNLCRIGGVMVPQFEEEFARMYGVPYAVASTSGTAAIHIALGALDLNPCDEVIAAPITDLGTVIPILSQNCIPVFADIDDTYNLDPADVERKITSRTKAIIAVHLFGNPCNMDGLVEVARRHRIPLIEDCAQAHVTEYKGRFVGTIGDIGCFSFQQSKHMTTGDGGMTITSNKVYHERMDLFADKGFARKDWGPRAYLFHAPNYRMTELVGAVGLAQLRKVRAVVQKRHEVGQYMSELVAKVQGVRPAPETPGGKHSYWLYPLILEEGDVNQFAQRLREQNVWAAPGYTVKPIYSCTESLTAKKTYGSSGCPFTCPRTSQTYEYREGLCPRAEGALKKLVCLYPDEGWTRETVEQAVKVIAKCRTSSATTAVSIPAVQKQAVQVSTRAGCNGDRIRIGIVGCGQIGRWHLDAYKRNPKVQLVGLADIDRAKSRQFAQEVGARAYESHRELVAKEKLDGVSLCTVPSTHREIALDLLDAGVHVLCEKPLAVSGAQAREMVARAQQKNRLLLTAFKFRFFEEVVKARELIQKGSFGRIFNFRLMFGGYIDMTGTWYARRDLAGGGIIMDNGPHAADLIRYLLGEIQSVWARCGRYQGIEVEDTAQLTFTLANGCVGTADLSWSASVPSRSYFEAYGEDGAMLLDWQGVACKYKTWSDWKRIDNKLTVKDAFARQIDHFVRAIHDGQASILGNGAGLQSQLVIDAAYESLKTQTAVALTT